MKQLKGKSKETSREKKQRRKDAMEMKKQVYTVVLPAIAVIFCMIVVYIYFKTRPRNYTDY